MARLPAPGGDDNTWGDILNDYLSQSLNSDGTLKTVSSSTLDSGTQTALGKANSAVQTVNGKTGSAVTIAASDISGVELTANKDVASGYAGLDSNTLLKVSELPRAAGIVVALGSVSGTVTCNLSTGIAFTATLTGDTTFQFSNWPASGLVEPEIYTAQDSSGGHSITVTGVTWEPTGSPPTFSTAPNAVNIIPVASFNGGSNIYGITGLAGPAGPTGATGPTGPAGASSTESYLGWVIAAGLTNPRINTIAAIGTAFKSFFVRAVIPKSGTLHDVTVFNGATVAGNHNVAVYDTGNASAAHYTPLWSSGSVAASGANNWQVVGDPALAVTAGQQLLLAVMNDGTTHTFGQGPAYNNAANAQLPAGFIPTTGGASPKLLGTFTFGSLAYSTITEANLSITGTPYMIIARVA